MYNKALFLRAAPEFSRICANLDERFRAWRSSATDVDADGRLFIGIFLFFVGGLVARGLLVSVSAVPIHESDISRCVAFCALSIGAAAIMQWRGHLEAALVLRSMAIAICATPWTLSVCALVFYFGRSHQFVDAWLAATDHAIGFDWPSYMRVVDRTPWLWTLLFWAYRSIIYQLPIICVVLALTRSARRLYAVLCAQIGALMIVSCIAVFMPALGTDIFYGSSKNIAHFSDLFSPEGVAATIRWLRGASFVGVLDPVPLITFPSYHAASAVIFIWALWKTPVARWVFLALNSLMLAATPALGCHYLTDVIAGGAIGAIAVFVAHAGVLRLDGFAAIRHSDGTFQPKPCPEPESIAIMGPT